MSRLRRQNRLCSSMVSDTANRLLKRTDSEGSSSVAEKKSSVVLLFRSGRWSLICARLRNKGKVGVQRGRETAGVPSFLPPRRVPRRSRRPQTANPLAEVQRKTLRPERANTLTQFAHPGFPVQKRSRPVRANPPAAVHAPRLSGAEKEPPRQGEHAHAVRAPRWVGAENPGNPEKIFPPEKAAKTPILTLRKRLFG